MTYTGYIMFMILSVKGLAREALGKSALESWNFHFKPCEVIICILILVHEKGIYRTCLYDVFSVVGLMQPR